MPKTIKEIIHDDCVICERLIKDKRFTKNLKYEYFIDIRPEVEFTKLYFQEDIEQLQKELNNIFDSWHVRVKRDKSIINIVKMRLNDEFDKFKELK